MRGESRERDVCMCKPWLTFGTPSWGEVPLMNKGGRYVTLGINNYYDKGREIRKTLDKYTEVWYNRSTPIRGINREVRHHDKRKTYCKDCKGG